MYVGMCTGICVGMVLHVWMTAQAPPAPLRCRCRRCKEDWELPARLAHVTITRIPGRAVSGILTSGALRGQFLLSPLYTERELPEPGAPPLPLQRGHQANISSPPAERERDPPPFRAGRICSQRASVYRSRSAPPASSVPAPSPHPQPGFYIKTPLELLWKAGYPCIRGT